MKHTPKGSPASDALVLFGVTGNLAHKMIFPALYATVKRGDLTVPVIGVASPPWSPAHLRKPIWNRNYVGSVQVTLAEDFGVNGRGAFYETAGCLRDVVENHLFQIVALFTREDAVEAVWAVVDRVLKHPRPTHRYKPGSWGPKEADALIAADGAWHSPRLDEETA
jgi:glucose-6-phosphate 1-dehydrogenase